MSRVLADAHPYPLVSDGKRAGDFRSCWRTTADRAWAYPWLEWGRTPTSTAALILDLVQTTPTDPAALARRPAARGRARRDSRHRRPSPHGRPVTQWEDFTGRKASRKRQRHG